MDELLTITRAPVEHCRRHAPVAWQIPGAKSGRKSTAQAERERKDRLWKAVAAKMAGKGYQGWVSWHCRYTFRHLKTGISGASEAILEPLLLLVLDRV